MNWNKIFFGILLIGVFSACGKQSVDPDEADRQIIEAYVATQGWTPQISSTGLNVVIDDAGTGKQPNSTSNVTVNYKGYLTDGTVFDETTGGSPRSFKLNQVIAGWTEGIPYFKEGGNGKLLIPSKLGYGSNKTGNIPPNSVLIFEIELITVK